MNLLIKFCFLLALISPVFSSANATEVGEKAPVFSLPKINNQTVVNLQQFAGKVVYLDFWASWCAPCRTSFPIMDNIYQQYRDQGFEVVAINLDEEVASAERFLHNNPVSFTVLRDAEGGWADQYQIESMPTSFMIDRKGVIRYVHQGFSKSDKTELSAKIAQLLKETLE